jgi:hypothetical protein
MCCRSSRHFTPVKALSRTSPGDHVSEFLIGMMKVNFLKRLESSVRSFAITMDRTVKKIEDLEARLGQFQELRPFQGAGLATHLFVMEAEEDEELREAFEVGTLQYRLEHMDVDRWLADLTRDKQQLSMLAESADGVTPDRDAKLAELKEDYRTQG